MNRENILAVADAIEKHSIPDLGFNMARWHSVADDRFAPDLSGHNCGTVACIGGWTLRVFGRDRKDGSEVASSILGLSEDWEKEEALFCPTGWNDGKLFPPSQAVSVLRHLAETGEVDWNVALAEPSK